MSYSTAAAPAVVGREAELARVAQFLAGETPLRALVLTGEPGIGKTTLWEAALASARELGLSVHVARPSEPELELSFVSLSDLLEDVDTGALGGVPSPQRRALEVVLLRAEPGDAPPEPRAVAAGLTRLLQTLSEREPVVLAIDDAPWLDRSSEAALTFAARRLAGRAVRFLIARRPGKPSALEHAFEPSGLEQLGLEPLSLGATRVLLSGRLGLSLPRRVLRRIFEATGGNPLFALELGRTLVERGIPELGADLPLQDLADDPFGERVSGLDEPAREALLAVALAGSVSSLQLARMFNRSAVENAVSAGLLVLEGDRVRVSHPLLAAAAEAQASADERRRVHRELARAVENPTRRAGHLALATEAPDTAAAETVAAAAAASVARGGAEDAVYLATQALRLTPAGSPERTERLLALADYLFAAGEHERLGELLAAELDQLPAGSSRVRAHLLLAAAAAAHVDEYRAHLEQALLEASGRPGLRATVIARRAEFLTVICVEQIAAAERSVSDALHDARAAGAAVEHEALFALAWARALRGRPIDHLFTPSSGPAPVHLYHAPDRLRAVRAAWRGEIDQARALVARLLALADERGEAGSYAVMRQHLFEFELRAGDFAAAARLLDEWDPLGDREVLMPHVFQRCAAQLAAGRGATDDADRLAADALEGAESTGMRWEGLEALRARGIAAMCAGQPARARESLSAIWEHAEREGVEDPGVFPVGPDLVEAAVTLGELEEAGTVRDRLARVSGEQDHPWGSASAKRCAALIALASAYDEQAAGLLAEAADAYGRMGMRFDRARSLLALGRSQRRFKKWAAARGSLEQAAATFDALPAPGWAEQARAELVRVGARRPAAPGTLTQAEERVARFAAEGLSNKEIAARLFVSVKTVERHLSHVYRKLGVRSRAQLAHRLGATS